MPSPVFNEYVQRKDGMYVTYNAAGSLLSAQQLVFVIDGNGAAIGAGVAGDITVPVDGTLTSVTLLADQVGDIVVDVWKDTYANYPPTNADTITGGNEPELSTAIKYQDSTLSGWTKTLMAGDTIRFNVDSAATVTKVTVILEMAVDNSKGGLFFTAFRAMEVIWIGETHEAAGSDAGSVELDIELLQGTEAPGAGSSVLLAPFDLTGAANTIQEYSGRSLTSARILEPFDRLSANYSGVLTDVSGVQVTVYLKFWGRGDYY